MDNIEKDIDVSEIKRNSMEGTKVVRDGKKVKMSREQYNKNMKTIAATAAITTFLGVGIVVGVGKATISTISNNMTIKKAQKDFYKEYIQDEKHQFTNDDGHASFYYDYEDIANSLEDYGNWDEAVYFVEQSLGEADLNEVLKYTDFQSFSNFKQVKGYDSTSEFNKNAKKQILVTEDIKEKEDELRKMTEDHLSSKEQLDELKTHMGGDSK